MERPANLFWQVVEALRVDARYQVLSPYRT
jgi:hypothetical protein